MSTIKPIIYLKGKLREDIKSFGFDEKAGQYFVKFKERKQNDGEEYEYLHYRPDNVDVAEFSRQLDPPLRVMRKSDGFVYSNVKGVRLFEGKEHSAYRVVFKNGYTNDYDSRRI